MNIQQINKYHSIYKKLFKSENGKAMSDSNKFLKFVPQSLI